MAKRLKKGRDAGGFAIEEEGREKMRKKKESKENTIGTIYTHLQNPLISKKRQHWEQTSHWLNLKGERKEGTKKGKGRKGGQKRNRVKHYYKGKYGSPVCLDRGVPPKVSLLNTV